MAWLSSDLYGAIRLLPVTILAAKHYVLTAGPVGRSSVSHVPKNQKPVGLFRHEIQFQVEKSSQCATPQCEVSHFVTVYKTMQNVATAITQAYAYHCLRSWQPLLF